MNQQNENMMNLKPLCDKLIAGSRIDPQLYEKFHVKRGLRRSDGTGVIAGITKICNVHGYVVNEGEIDPIPGELIYRGYQINDLVSHAEQEGRFGFEETVYLLLLGDLPNRQELDAFTRHLSACRPLPENFVVDMILKAPSNNIMNKMARSVLALYSYDAECETKSIENELRTAISLVAKLPVIMASAYQVKRSHFDGESMIMHPLRPEENTAQTVLSLLRNDRQYTDAEAHLLDTLMTLHAEHGGGNNSTFTTRVVTSSGTDTYSAMAAALCSLKGPRHGGANLMVMHMMQNIRDNLHDIEDDEELEAYLKKLLHGEAFDRKGLIYGMGHAVYSLSDPREVVFKGYVEQLAHEKGRDKELSLYTRIERMAPQLIAQERKIFKGVSPNVDFYSGFVYEMLGIPMELYTPLFAVARIMGWSAHRIEELLSANKIIRPAYKSLGGTHDYIPRSQRA